MSVYTITSATLTRQVTWSATMTRKTKIVSGAVGVLFTFLAGVAVAAILLSTGITGNATVKTVPGTGGGPGGNGGGVSNQVSVDVDATAVNGSNLDCSAISVSPDSKTMTFNPVLTKVAANGENASSQPVPGGECTIRVAVKNTGDVNISVQSADLVINAAGWNVSDPTGLDRTIAPGDTQVLTAKVTATGNAVAGTVTGQLVYAG